MSRTRRPLAALAAIAVIALTSEGCGSTSATATGTGTGSGAANTTSTKHAKAVKFSECMRSHGVSGFPDPDATGELTLDGVLNGSSLNPSSPAWKHAIGVCEHLEPSGFTGHKRTPQQQAAALKFAQCIRENGVTDFPDPVSGQPLVDTNRIPSAAAPGGMTILNAAMHKCRGMAAAAGVQR